MKISVNKSTFNLESTETAIHSCTYPNVRLSQRDFNVLGNPVLPFTQTLAPAQAKTNRHQYKQRLFFSISRFRRFPTHSFHPIFSIRPRANEDTWLPALSFMREPIWAIPRLVIIFEYLLWKYTITFRSERNSGPSPYLHKFIC
jgi:hypothetical protein